MRVYYAVGIVIMREDRPICSIQPVKAAWRPLVRAFCVLFLTGFLMSLQLCSLKPNQIFHLVSVFMHAHHTKQLTHQADIKEPAETAAHCSNDR